MEFLLKKKYILSCFCCCLETQVLACIYIYIHSNSGRCTQLHVKHAKCLPVLAIKEMGTLSNLKNASQKRAGGIIWIKDKKSPNKLSRNGKLVGGREMGTCMESGNRMVISTSNRKLWIWPGKVSKEKRREKFSSLLRRENSSPRIWHGKRPGTDENLDFSSEGMYEMSQGREKDLRRIYFSITDGEEIAK